MSAPITRKRRFSINAGLDNLFFVAAGVAAVWYAYILLTVGFGSGWWQISYYLVFWVVLAYLVLPRLHRIFTNIYVPNYFMGRTRTSDGLLGDPVNLGFLGDDAQLHAAMTRAGWTRADDLSLRSGLRIVRSTLLRRSYNEAPVSPLMLFERQQDFAYQQEVAGNPAKRHHVRFWRCPPGWMLPGGIPVDWLAAGTYDRAVGFSLFTLQVTHKIDANTDIERDHIVGTVSQIPGVSVSVIEDFSSGYHARNGGGDSIITDGDLPIVNVRGIADAGSAPVIAALDPNKRPSSIVVGFIITLARAATALGLAGIMFAAPQAFFDDLTLDGQTQEGAIAVAIGALIVFSLLDIAFAFLLLMRNNTARIIIMLLSFTSIVAQAIDFFNGGPQITVHTTLPSLSLDILVLLALSSPKARAWSRRMVVGQ